MSAIPPALPASSAASEKATLSASDWEQAALDLIAEDPDLQRIGERLVTHHFDARDLGQAFAVASSRACIKAVVTHAEEEA